MKQTRKSSTKSKLKSSDEDMSKDTRQDETTATTRDTTKAGLTTVTKTTTGSKIVVVGLDLSLRAAGAVRFEAPWSLDFKDIEHMVTGHALPRTATEYDRMCRLSSTKKALLEFCEGASVVVVEQYAFSRGMSQAHALGEMGGVVKHALHERGIEVVPVVASHVRACLGKFPRKDTKVFVEAAVRKMGAPDDWTADEVDAFVCANGYCVEEGLGGIMVER
jgi:Holliday junction resolvasome RuvABC endonuclease subunit